MRCTTGCISTPLSEEMIWRVLRKVRFLRQPGEPTYAIILGRFSRFENRKLPRATNPSEARFVPVVSLIAEVVQR
jgi:hypothetical protein